MSKRRSMSLVPSGLASGIGQLTLYDCQKIRTKEGNSKSL